LIIASSRLRLGFDAQVHVRVGLVGVQHHDVAVIGELDPRELARRLQNAQRVGPLGHREHDVEGLLPMAEVIDVGAAEPPLTLDVPEGIAALLHDATVVLYLDPATLADVAKVRGDRLHAATSARDLDHALRRATDGGFNPVSDRVRLAYERAETRRSALHDPVAGVEEALAPLDEDAVDCRGPTHAQLPWRAVRRTWP
jgi:hypothetical protein